jgi:ribosomal protein S18 acetylase RimI-like enzyme
MTRDETKPHQGTLTARRATRNDILFLAWCNVEATSPEPGFCYWDPLLEATGTPTIRFVEALLQHGALAWGEVEQFFVLEKRGKPVAGASAFSMHPDDYRPLRLERLADVARDLGWSDDALNAFRTGYERVWSDPKDATLAPHAPWIIECVAVIPEARGRGMTRALFDEGRRLGHTRVGISVTTGNLAAQRAYEAIGFQLYVQYGADYFDGAFPGTTKYRLRLDTKGVKP